MWNSIKRWRDWAMRDLFWPLFRSSGPQAQEFHFCYEKAGLVVRDEPIPWNAEAVLVEARVRFPSAMVRRKTEFQLRAPGLKPLAAASLYPAEQEGVFCLLFRLPPIRQSTAVELVWRSSTLGHVVLPTLSEAEFIAALQLQAPTVFARLGEHNVPCGAFVGPQCRGLVASGMLTSPTSLVPLRDLEMTVDFTDHRSKKTQTAKVQLTSGQLSARQALVSVSPKRRPRLLGAWSARWRLGERELADSRVRIVAQRAFRRSLWVSDSRFVYQDKTGATSISRGIPPRDQVARLGPCFLLASREPGLAALCHLEVLAHLDGGLNSPVLFEEDVIVTDGPTLFSPGTIAVEDLDQVRAFELQSNEQTLGLLSMCPTPAAVFTSEGGFQPPLEYSWSGVTEEELADRLAKLMEP